MRTRVTSHLCLSMLIVAAVLVGVYARAGSVTIRPGDFVDLGKARAQDDMLTLYEEGAVLCAVSVPAEGTHTFVLIARGEEAGGEWPILRVTLDGKEVFQTHVRSGKLTTYTFQENLVTGKQEIGVAFLNDYFDETGDRNLYVASLTILSPDEQTSPEILKEDAYQDLVGARRNKLFKEADARIRNLRMGRLAVRVVDSDGAPVFDAQVTVRQKRHEFPFGVALASQVFDESLPEEQSEEYLKNVRRYFNHAVTENALKWPMMECERGQVNYDVIDRMLDWCATYRLTLRGHCVFWGCEGNIPQWALRLSDDDLRNAICLRARVLSARYKGKIDEFDVSNEMLHCDYFERRFGEGIRRQMFHEILAPNPRARLYVNDYGILSGDKLDAYVRHIAHLLESGVPVGGIGVQGHFSGPVDPVQVWESLDELARFRLPIKITEFDCLVDDENVQAESLEALYRIAFSHPAVHGILMWSFWETCSWKPEAALLRADFSKKPAAEAYRRLVCDAWWTDEEGWVNADGLFDCDAFFGSLEVVAETADGREASKVIQHRRREGSSEVTLTLLGADEKEQKLSNGIPVVEAPQPSNEARKVRQPLFERWFGR